MTTNRRTSADLLLGFSRSATDPGRRGRAVSLLRVSTERQTHTATDLEEDGLSIATQRDHNDAKAEKLNADVVKEFIEPGYSGKTIDKRPIIREIMEYLHATPDIDYLIVYMRSRAFRNHFDAAVLQIQLQKLGVRLVSAKEDFGEGPQAVAMEGMIDIMNGLQNTLQGLDISTKMRQKAINGGTLGQARLGYLNVSIELDGKKINTVDVDEKRAPLVVKAFELYATGDYTLERLEATMADLGLTARANRRWPERPVTFKWLHRMLKDPYYIGYVTYQGEVYQGRHEALIDPELFYRVQEVMASRSGSGSRDRVYYHYLKGGLFCDRCAKHDRTARLIYTEAKGRGGTYQYFFCRMRKEGTCDLPFLPVELVEAAVLDHYRALQLEPEFIANVTKILDDAVTDRQGSVRAMHAQLNRRLKELDVKEERLLDLATEGELPQAKIKARLRKIEIDRESARSRMVGTTAELATGVEVVKTALELAANPYSLYQRADDDTRRFMNETFFQALYLDDTGIQTGTLKPPFDDFQEAERLWSTAQMPETTRGPRIAEASYQADKSGEPTLSGIVLVSGLNKTSVVELRGIEPLTFSMRTRRATNCAIAPCGSWEPRCDTVSGQRRRLRIGAVSWGDARHGPDRGLFARGAAHVLGAVAEGAGGGRVEGLQLFEVGGFVVRFEQDGAAAQGAGGVPVHADGGAGRAARGRGLGVFVLGPGAAAVEPGGAAAPDLLLHPHLLAQVREVADEHDEAQAGAPPQRGGDGEAEAAAEQTGEQEAEHGALPEGVAGGAGDGVGFRVVAAAAAAGGHEVVVGALGGLRCVLFVGGAGLLVLVEVVVIEARGGLGGSGRDARAHPGGGVLVGFGFGGVVVLVLAVVLVGLVLVLGGLGGGLRGLVIRVVDVLVGAVVGVRRVVVLVVRVVLGGGLPLGIGQLCVRGPILLGAGIGDGVFVVGDGLVGRSRHPILRIIALGKPSRASGWPVVGVGVVRAVLAAAFRAAPVQHAGRQRGVGGAPDARVAVGEHGEENEDPQHDEPDPQDRIRHVVNTSVPAGIGPLGPRPGRTPPSDRAGPRPGRRFGRRGGTSARPLIGRPSTPQAPCRRRGTHHRRP